jgi:hypothetical protein
VSEHRTLLEGFAFTLLENEVLEREDIERLVSAYRGESADGRPTAAERRREPGAPQVAASERLDEPPQAV